MKDSSHLAGRASCAAILLALALVSLAAQQPPEVPTFKAEVEYVEVDAVVTDEAGSVVRNLRKEDFQIFEDGKSQSIAGFAFIEIPVEKASQGPLRTAFAEPDVRTNERPFAGRVYVLVLDDLHTAALRAPRLKRAAQQFIDQHLGANDLMAVVHVGGSSDRSQEFTSNKRLLATSVDRFMGQKLESATLARNEQFFNGPSVAGGRPGDPFDSERGFQARTTTRVLTEVAEKLSAIRGRRKTIVFMSEGIDYDITDVMGNRSATSIVDGMRDAIAAATRSNASIYAVDPRGLTDGADDAIGVSIFADQRPLTAQSDPDAPPGEQRRTGIGTGSLQSELQLSQDSLRTLAEETNGFAAVNTNDFRSAFDRIVAASSAYYLLAYDPPSGRRDGKFHRIDVRVTRPGLTVRARRGYVAPKPDAKSTRAGGGDVSAPLVRALNSVVPSAGLKMRAFAAPFRGPGTNGSVVIGLELRGAGLSLADGSRIELAYVAVDASGGTRVNTDAFTFKLPAAAKTAITERGIRFLTRVNLPPGRYQFRIGAFDVTSGAVGTVIYDLEIPAFSKLPFAMSGILVTSRDATSTVTARADVELQKFMSAPPVSQRTFAQSDDVLAFAEIYDRAEGPPHSVDISTTVMADDGRIVFEQSAERSSAEMQRTNGAYVHSIRVPVAELTPGTYVLRIEARSRLGQTESRQMAFDVIQRTE